MRSGYIVTSESDLSSVASGLVPVSDYLVLSGSFTINSSINITAPYERIYGTNYIGYNANDDTQIYDNYITIAAGVGLNFYGQSVTNLAVSGSPALNSDYSTYVAGKGTEFKSCSFLDMTMGQNTNNANQFKDCIFPTGSLSNHHIRDCYFEGSRGISAFDMNIITGLKDNCTSLNYDMGSISLLTINTFTEFDTINFSSNASARVIHIGNVINCTVGGGIVAPYDKIYLGAHFDFGTNWYWFGGQNFVGGGYSTGQTPGFDNGEILAESCNFENLKFRDIDFNFKFGMFLALYKCTFKHCDFDTDCVFGIDGSQQCIFINCTGIPENAISNLEANGCKFIDDDITNIADKLYRGTKIFDGVSSTSGNIVYYNQFGGIDSSGYVTKTGDIETQTYVS